MQYKVPQNIDQEDKILGPFTFVQFIYVLIGGGLILLAFTVFDLTLALLVSVPVGLLTLGFSLVKIQDQPFSRYFLAFLVYLRHPKQRVWRQSATDETQPTDNSGLGTDFLEDSKEDDDFFGDSNKKNTKNQVASNKIELSSDLGAAGLKNQISKQQDHQITIPAAVQPTVANQAPARKLTIAH